MILIGLFSCHSLKRDQDPAPLIQTSASRQVWGGFEIPDLEALKGLKWSEQDAFRWYKDKGWINGANFLPSTAGNMLEMWNAETFDPDTIRRELGWASELGMNTMRVFLPYILWKEDSLALISRINLYLDIAAKQNIKTVFVLFDSVWHPYPETGKQPEPLPGIHNSIWVQSPGLQFVMDPEEYSSLKDYVQGIMGHYSQDERVLFWDLMNEPDNGNIPRYNKMQPQFKNQYIYRLLSLTFLWARESHPDQPLTAGVWTDDWSRESSMPFVRLQLDASDIISFHVYDDLKGSKNRVDQLLPYNRPLICTEYMARTIGSTLIDIAPYFQKNHIGAIHWGLVSGRSQTIYPWDSWQNPFTEEPAVWFHDILRPDGTPFDLRESKLFQKLNQK
ncbi:cellulase family glycosylhydrolase [Oceanispirochaeta sp.]|uniref:cellulase family glycosylhydrolase n=1 Tax=Oceanispirochaeta sp. TaxID=2035350 RepID=UPI00262595C6|nr:cellulase family glycosylhydrolase [Oceanispirochaeta sp.]MDA3956718.1 cellulase family glycosylhydrolase [Oceanispirochaeta sp.]